MTTLSRSPCHHCLQAPATFFQLIGLAVISDGGLAAREPLQLLLDFQACSLGNSSKRPLKDHGTILVPRHRQFQGHAPADLEILIGQQFPHGREAVRSMPSPQRDCGHRPANANPVAQGLEEGLVRLAVHHANLNQDRNDPGDHFLVFGTRQKRQEGGHGAWRSAHRQHPKQRFGWRELDGILARCLPASGQGLGSGACCFAGGRAHERTDPRPQFHQAVRRSPTCFHLLGFQFAKKGLSPVQLIVRQGPRLRTRVEAGPRWSFVHQAAHTARRSSRDTMSLPLGAVDRPFPRQAGQVLVGLGRKGGRPVGQAFDQHRDRLTIVRIGQRRGYLEPDGRV